MKIRKSGYGDLWVVTVEPNELMLTATKAYAPGGTVGTINKRGTLSVWRPAAGAPRDWSKLARYKLEEARTQLFKSGELRNVKAEKSRKEEAKTGSFIVKLSNGKTSRFHSMTKASASQYATGASEWADEQLKKPDVQWAEFYRALPSGAPPREGAPWTLPFQALEKNEYGIVKYARIDKKRTPRRVGVKRSSGRDHDFFRKAGRAYGKTAKAARSAKAKWTAAVADARVAYANAKTSAARTRAKAEIAYANARLRVTQASGKAKAAYGKAKASVGRTRRKSRAALGAYRAQQDPASKKRRSSKGY